MYSIKGRNNLKENEEKKEEIFGLVLLNYWWSKMREEKSYL